MGQDIHSKILIKSKIEKKFIDGMSLSTYSNSMFSPLYDGRNYDFFSLFGSQRGNYKEIPGANYGIPEFLPETYKQFLIDSDYYGYIWWNIQSFQRNIKKYIKLIQNPSQYYIDDPQQVQLFEKYPKYLKEYDITMTYFRNELNNFLDRINEINAEASYISKYIDIKDTVFLFYFDS